MEDFREGDCRVPLISSIFFICLATGGVFLALYVFTPSLSKPWFPVVAFTMIGTPWAFWFITYIYSCMKYCLKRGGSMDQRQISRKNFAAAPSRTRSAAGALSSKHTVGRGNAADAATASHEAAAVLSSPGEGKRVQFAEVVVLGEENSVSIASSRESEMPLNVGLSSSS